MEPINQKERSAIFIQFLLIYSISLIVVGLLVYFNTRVVKKDYQVMKEKLTELENSTDFVGELTLILTTTKERIGKLDIKNESDFNYEKNEIISAELSKLRTDSQSNGVDTLKNILHTLCNTWINDKYKLLEIAKLNKDLEKKDKIIDRYYQQLLQCGVSEEKLDLTKMDAE